MKLTHYQTSLSFPSFLTAFVPVNLPTLTTQVLYFVFSILYHIFKLFNQFGAFLCRFYANYCVIILHHLPAVFIVYFCDFSVACCQPFL